MKRLTILAAAVMMAAGTFAATITYEMNGGKTNDYGWRNKQDMFASWVTDLGPIVTNSAGESRAYAGEVPSLDSLAAGNINFVAATLVADGSFLPMMYTWMQGQDKWKALAEYIAAVSVEQEGTPIEGTSGKVPNLTTASQTYWRFAMDAFWQSKVVKSWPYSPDYTIAGSMKAISAGTKMGWTGDTDNTVEDFILPEPYFEGESFLGWYDNAEFSGKKLDVAAVKALTSDAILYAKHGEYIPNCQELFAMMPADTAGVKDTIATKAQGTVTFVNGGQFYIQDVYGAMLCYTKNHKLAEGDQVTFSCGLVNYNGYPELINVANIEKDGNAAWTPADVDMAAVAANPDAFMFQLVRIQGAKIAEYDANGNMYVFNGQDKIELYNPDKTYPDQTKFAVGKRVNFSGIVCLFNKNLQFANHASQIELAPIAGVDPYDYPEVAAAGYKFNFTNNWIYSAKMNNWSANKPNPSGEQSRGMAAVNGKVYVSWFMSNAGGSQDYALKVYDGATGEKLDDILLEEHVGSIQGDSIINIPFGFFCEIKNDQAGHLVTNNLPTTGGDFVVYVLNDPEDEASYVNGKLTGYPLIEKTQYYTLEDGTPMTLLRDDYPNVGDIRFDRIGILGDVTKDAKIYCPREQATGVCWFQIKDGKWDGKTHYVPCQMPVENGKFGYTPQVFPVEGNMFYVDCSNYFPILYDADGCIVDSFDGDNSILQLGIDGETTRNPSGCGVTEFEVNGAYLLAIAGEGFDGASGATTTFAIYACADEERAFSEMTQLWEYPHDGMAVGANNPKNPQFVQVTAIEPVDDTHANVFVYAAETGLAGYTIEAVADGSGLEKIEENASIKLIENNQVVIVRDGVKYNVLGVEVK